MQTVLGNNIQLGKNAMGKNPLASLGKVGKMSAGGDFSNILAMLSGKTADATSKLDEKVMMSLMNGEIPEGMTAEEASELKREALLTSKKHATHKMLETKLEGKETLEVEATPEKKAEVLDLEKVLKTDVKKVSVKGNEIPLENNLKQEGELALNKTALPQKKAEVALQDNTELLSLRQNAKNSKAQASKEYTKGQNPFESNVIQLKKTPKFEKESVAAEHETMKPFDLLVRDSSPQVQQVNHEPKMSLTLGGAAATTKALDLGNANSSAEIVNKIVNYLEQQNIQNSDRIEVTVKHETLGQFNVNVQKTAQGDDLNMQIFTQTAAGREFFVSNENQLTKTLLDHGLKLNDFKIQNMTTEMMATSKSSTSDGQSFSGNTSGNDHSGQRYYNERQESQNQDSRRRQELWQQYRERSLA